MKNPVDFSDFAKTFTQSVDLFICSSSFEERCFLLPSRIKALGVNKSLIIYNENEYQEIIDNAIKLQNNLGSSAVKIALNSDNPIDSGQIINNYIGEVLETEIGNIFLDSTTFTHETLLVILRLLFFKKAKYKKLFIGYVGASDYSIKESVEDKWLSSGISDVRSILGYPGSLSPARDYHLIVLFGFESERTKKLIDELHPDRISIGFGDKSMSINDSFQSLNHQRHEKLIELYPNAEEFRLSLVNPNSAKEKILEQSAKYDDYNVIVAPMNNKISTIGAALAAIQNPKIQLIYAKSINYNVNGYSTPADNCYLFELTF
jgi:hypothetical protein